MLSALQVHAKLVLKNLISFDLLEIHVIITSHAHTLLIF